MVLSTNLNYIKTNMMYKDTKTDQMKKYAIGKRYKQAQFI